MEVNRSREDNLRARKVLVDSSFILTAVELGSHLLSSIDELVGPIEKATVKQVIDELRRLSLSRGGKASKAKLALKLAEGLEVLSLNPNLGTDEEIINVASEKNLIVATTDSDLIKKLKVLGLPVVYVKGKKLEVEGLIDFC